MTEMEITWRVISGEGEWGEWDNCNSIINKYINPPQKNKNKNKLSKQVEQEEKQRNEDHMEHYQWGEGGGRMGEKVQEA